MKTALFAAASLFAFSTAALADSTVTVATDPAAPESNFENPGNTARAGYTLTLGDNGSSVTGVIAQTGGDAAGSFANLYFDLNPTVMDGSDLGFELGANGAIAFIPGKNGQDGFSTALLASDYNFSAVTLGGLTTLSFSLANSLFTSPIAGLNYYGPADDCGGGTPCPVQTFESNVTLRLSQSLGYSVAGGASYGDNRLGSVTVGSAGAVPEPAAWAMMLVGLGAAGYRMRRRRYTSTLRLRAA